MPDVAVHASFGREVLASLSDEVRAVILPEPYTFALFGPDLWFMYRPWRRREGRGRRMHTVTPGAFLSALLRKAGVSAARPELHSYLAGFLCHYALDATTHPYINRKAKNDFAMHIAIEHRLDRENGGELVLPPFLPDRLKGEVGGAITKIYGWQDAWEKMKAGRRDMEPFYHMIRDEKGLLNRLLYHSHTKAAWLTCRSDAADGIDLRGFYPLYRKAVESAVTYLQAADSFVRGEIDETQLREVIGNCSYIEGKECADP